MSRRVPEEGIVAEGKWIDGLTPTTPADEAARLVLAARLDAVAHHLPLAVEKAAEDAEHVHQLRVATRRAGAALRIFRALLPKKPHRRAKEVLRALRRAAGDARDWDVFLDGLGDGDGPAHDFLAGYGVARRAAAQVVLAGVVAEWAPSFKAVRDELPAAPRLADDAPTTLGALAAHELGCLFAEFGEEIDAMPATPAELHQLRITGKRVRYAMEVFAGCHGPTFRDVLYPAVEQVQTILGAIQDGHVARDRLAAIATETATRPVAERVRPGFTALVTQTKTRVAAEKRAFRRWVRDWKKLAAAHPLADTRL